MTKKILLASTMSALLLSVTACSDKKEEPAAGKTGAVKVAVPKLSKAEVHSILDAKKTTLSSNGFSVIKKDDNYNLGLAQETKARTYLYNEIQSMLPASYASILANAKNDIIYSNKDAFKGTSIDFTVVEDKESAKIKVTLASLPKELEKELDRSIKRNNSEAKIAQHVKDIVAAGKLNLTLSLNKAGAIVGVAMADFDETFSTKEGSVAIKSAGLYTNFMGDKKEKTKVEGKWNTFNVDFDIQKKGKGHFTMKDIGLNVDQKDTFNSIANFTMGTIDFTTTYADYTYDWDTYKKIPLGDVTVSLNVKNLATSSSSKRNNDAFDTSMGFKIASVNFAKKSKKQDNTLALEGFNFKLSLNNLAAKPIEKLYKWADTFSGDLNRKEKRQLANMAEAITQHGFTLAIDNFDIGSLVAKASGDNLSLHDMHIDVQAVLAKNDIAIDDYKKLIPLVTVSGKLTLSEKEYEAIKQLQPRAFKMLDTFKKVENGKVIFAISFKDGKPMVNGKPLQ